MSSRIRVLDVPNRTMQRLGYLKALCAIVNETETSNLESLGRRFIERVTKRIKLSPPFDDEIKAYAKSRLTDGAYRDVRKVILGNSIDSSVSLEIQDIYLANSDLPSRTGKLVEANWRKYPNLGTSLELVKRGTYSALTRSLVFLLLTPKVELSAFIEVDREHNPLILSDAQALVLLYCFIDNDAEVVIPLYKKLAVLDQTSFTEREASEFLPDIFRQISKNYLNRAIPAEARERLAVLNKTAASIEKWKGKAYTGGGAREEVIRVRLEPFCDLGFLNKPDKDRYEYQFTPSCRVLLEKWESSETTDQFLQGHFFSTFAACRGIICAEADDTEALEALRKAGDDLKSSLGYSPIVDVGLLAGIRLLTEKGKALEISRTFDLLKAFQKRDPTLLRFTVDRMGSLAYVKFLRVGSGA